MAIGVSALLFLGVMARYCYVNYYIRRYGETPTTRYNRAKKKLVKEQKAREFERDLKHNFEVNQVHKFIVTVQDHSLNANKDNSVNPLGNPNGGRQHISRPRPHTSR